MPPTPNIIRWIKNHVTRPADDVNNQQVSSSSSSSPPSEYSQCCSLGLGKIRRKQFTTDTGIVIPLNVTKSELDGESGLGLIVNKEDLDELPSELNNLLSSGHVYEEIPADEATKTDKIVPKTPDNYCRNDVSNPSAWDLSYNGKPTGSDVMFPNGTARDGVNNQSNAWEISYTGKHNGNDVAKHNSNQLPHSGDNRNVNEPLLARDNGEMTGFRNIAHWDKILQQNINANYIKHHHIDPRSKMEISPNLINSVYNLGTMGGALNHQGACLAKADVNRQCAGATRTDGKHVYATRPADELLNIQSIKKHLQRNGNYISKQVDNNSRDDSDCYAFRPLPDQTNSKVVSPKDEPLSPRGTDAVYHPQVHGANVHEMLKSDIKTAELPHAEGTKTRLPTDKTDSSSDNKMTSPIMPPNREATPESPNNRQPHSLSMTSLNPRPQIPPYVRSNSAVAPKCIYPTMNKSSSLDDLYSNLCMVEDLHTANRVQHVIPYQEPLKSPNIIKTEEHILEKRHKKAKKIREERYSKRNIKMIICEPPKFKSSQCCDHAHLQRSISADPPPVTRTPFADHLLSRKVKSKQLQQNMRTNFNNVLQEHNVSGKQRAPSIVRTTSLNDGNKENKHSLRNFNPSTRKHFYSLSDCIDTTTEAESETDTVVEKLNDVNDYTDSVISDVVYSTMIGVLDNTQQNTSGASDNDNQRETFGNIRFFNGVSQPSDLHSNESSTDDKLAYDITDIAPADPARFECCYKHTEVVPTYECHEDFKPPPRKPSQLRRLQHTSYYNTQYDTLQCFTRTPPTGGGCGRTSNERESPRYYEVYADLKTRDQSLKSRTSLLDDLIRKNYDRQVLYLI